jgi:hypothetical protein
MRGSATIRAKKGHKQRSAGPFRMLPARDTCEALSLLIPGLSGFSWPSGAKLSYGAICGQAGS